MHLEYTPYMLPAVLSAMLSATAAVYAFRRRGTPGAGPLAAMSLSVAVWALGYALEIAGADLATKLLFADLQFIGIVAVPVSWVAFAVQYAGQGHLLDKTWGRLWLIVPIITLLLIASNTTHSLIRTDPQLATEGPFLALIVTPGAGYWIFITYAYLSLVIGTSIILIQLARLPYVFRPQIVLLTFGVLAPWVAEAVYIFDIDPVPHLNVTVFVYAISNIALCWALYHLRLFELVPLARAVVIDQLDDGMLVVDTRRRIVDCNPAAARLLHRADLIDQPLADVLALALDAAADSPAIEMNLHDCHCEIRVRALNDEHGRPDGHLILLRDITARRRADDELHRSQAQLSAVVNTAQDAIIVLDERQRIVIFNTGAEQIFGRRADEVVGGPLDPFIPARFRAAHLKWVQQFAETGQTTRAMGAGHVLALRSDGTEFSAEASISRTNVVGHNLYTVILRDISTRVQFEQELRAQKQLFENLVTVARATSARPDLDDTLRNVLQVAVSLTTATRGSLFMVDGDGAATHTLHVRDNAPPDERREMIGRVMTQGLVGWVARHQQPALITDTQTDDRWLMVPNEVAPTRSVLAVPILNGQALLGVIMLQHGDVGHFTIEHVRLMQAAADQMALAVRNARSFETQRRMAERQKTLYEILRTVGGQLDRDAVARTATEAISMLTGWPNVAVVMPDDQWQNWIVRAVSGTLPLTVGLSYPLDSGIIGRAFTTGRVQHVADVRADPDHLFVDSATRSKLALPLRRGDRVLGVLNIDSPQLAAFDVDDVSLARSLADAVALALDNARLYQVNADETSRLQALISSSRDGIIMLSMDQRVLVVNEPALRLLGMPGTVDQWLGRTVREAVRIQRHTTPRLTAVALNEIRRVQRGDEPPAEGEYELPPYTVHWINLPVLRGSQSLGRLVVLRDVTEERLLAKMRDDLTYTMVHDLRNPLTIIRSAIELLEGGGAGELSLSQQQILAVASSGAQRMLELVTAILDVTRLENGQMPLEREPTTLGALVDDMLGLQNVLAAEKQLYLRNEIPESLPPVSVDVELMGRVFQNLISNAIKFTPVGGCIIVGAQVNTDERQKLTVWVKDDGPGLPLEVQSQLFRKFVTGRVKGRGSGLGLAFCRLVVEAHGGRIWAESTPGQGTTFKFTLPVEG